MVKLLQTLHAISFASSLAIYNLPNRNTTRMQRLRNRTIMQCVKDVYMLYMYMCSMVLVK